MNTAYHLWLDESAKGPFTINQVKAMWNNGQLTGENLVSMNAGQDWHYLSDIQSVLEPEPPAVVEPPVTTETPSKVNASKRTIGVLPILLLVLLAVCGGGGYAYYHWAQEKQKLQAQEDSRQYALKIKASEGLILKLISLNQDSAQNLQKSWSKAIEGGYAFQSVYDSEKPSLDASEQSSQNLLDAINKILLSKVAQPPPDGVEAHNKLIELCGVAQSNQQVVFNPNGSYDEYVQKCNSSFEQASKLVGEIDAIYPDKESSAPQSQAQ